MRYVEVPAQPPADQFIHSVWFLSGPAGSHPPQPIVPDGRVELLVHRGEPFDRIEKHGARTRQAPVLLAGQLTGPLHVIPAGPVDVVGIRLDPLGASALLGMPLDLVTNQVVSLSEISRDLARALQSAVHVGDSPVDQARLAVRALMHRVVEGPGRQLAGAVALLGQHHSPPIGWVASRLGISRRTLERRFQQEVGLRPKMFQRVVRFRRAFRVLSQTPPGGWSRIALESGYYDQAHLIRDFRRFAGTAPRTFFGTDPELAQAFLSNEE